LFQGLSEDQSFPAAFVKGLADIAAIAAGELRFFNRAL
jgi:hypothetical protein